jgi:hypothetical protein
MNRLDHKTEPLDSLDGLLGAYFRSEMPEPWPAFTRRSPTTVLPPKPESKPTSWWAMYSRLALALSVLVLLGGAWMLSGMSGPASSNGKIDVSRGGALRKNPEILLPKPKDKDQGLPSEDELKGFLSPDEDD